jgi:hypothetical protein|nr:MAG TPA: hypothetical protein [Caudoviricetes sp.]
MKTVQIDAGRNNICYLIDAKTCHIVSQLYSVTPINARRMLDFEGLLKEYKNMDNLFVLHNSHIYNSQNILIF